MSSRLSPAARSAKWHFALIAGVAALLMALTLECVFAVTGASRYFYANSTHVLPFEHSIAPVQPLNLGTGDVQLTLTWNGTNDLDLHCIGPDGQRIYFASRRSPSGGYLDLDMNASSPYSEQGTENIFWPTGGAPAGAYHVFVHHYRRHGGQDNVLYTLRILRKGEVTIKQGWATFQSPPSTQPNSVLPELEDPDRVNALPPQEVTAFTIDAPPPSPLVRMDYVASVGVVAAWLGLLAAAIAGSILGGLNRWYRANPELIFQQDALAAATTPIFYSAVPTSNGSPLPDTPQPNGLTASPTANETLTDATAQALTAKAVSSANGSPPLVPGSPPSASVAAATRYPSGMFVKGVLTTSPVTRRIVILSLLWGALIGGIAQIYFGTFAEAAINAIELWRWLGWMFLALWLGGRLGQIVPTHLPLRDARRGGFWGGTLGGVLFSFLVVGFADKLGNSDLLLQGADSFARLFIATIIGACIGYQVWLPYPPAPEPEPVVAAPIAQPIPQVAPAPAPIAAPAPLPKLKPPIVVPEPELEPEPDPVTEEPTPEPDTPSLPVEPPLPSRTAPERPDMPRLERTPIGRPTSGRDTGLGRRNGLGRENSIGRRWTP